MMHIIIGEELYDADYVQRYTNGFEALDELAREALDLICVARAPAIVDPNIASRDPTQALQPLSKC